MARVLSYETSSQIGSPATSISWNHTINKAIDALLIVSVHLTGTATTVSSVTYGGASLTFLTSAQRSAQNRTEVWYLKNPPMGTNTVSVTITGGQTDIIGFAITLNHVNTTIVAHATSGANGEASTPSVSLNYGWGSIFAMDFVTMNATPAVLTPGTGQEQLLQTSVASLRAACSVKKPENSQGAGTYAMSWTGDTKPWSQILVLVARSIPHVQTIHCSIVPSTTQQLFFSLYGRNSTTTNDNNVKTVVPTCTITDFRVRVDTAPGGTASWQITMAKNGVGTGSSVTISGSNTIGESFITPLSLVQGDQVSWIITPSGNPASTRMHISASLTMTEPGRAAALAPFNNSIGSGTFNLNPFSETGWDSLSRNFAPIPVTTRIRHMHVFLSAAPGGTNSRTLTLRVNGSNTSMAATLTGTQTYVKVSPASPIDAAAGSYIDVLHTSSGTPATSFISVCLEYETVSAPDTFLISTNPRLPLPNNTDTQYYDPYGQERASPDNSSTNRYGAAWPVTIIGMAAMVTSGIGSGILDCALVNGSDTETYNFVSFNRVSSTTVLTDNRTLTNWIWSQTPKIKWRPRNSPTLPSAVAWTLWVSSNPPQIPVIAHYDPTNTASLTLDFFGPTALDGKASVLPVDTTIIGVSGSTNTAIPSGASVTVTLRKNGISTGLSFSFTPTFQENRSIVPTYAQALDTLNYLRSLSGSFDPSIERLCAWIVPEKPDMSLWFGNTDVSYTDGSVRSSIGGNVIVTTEPIASRSPIRGKLRGWAVHLPVLPPEGATAQLSLSINGTTISGTTMTFTDTSNTKQRVLLTSPVAFSEGARFAIEQTYSGSTAASQRAKVCLILEDTAIPGTILSTGGTVTNFGTMSLIGDPANAATRIHLLTGDVYTIRSLQYYASGANPGSGTYNCELLANGSTQLSVSINSSNYTTGAGVHTLLSTANFLNFQMRLSHGGTPPAATNADATTLIQPVTFSISSDVESGTLSGLTATVILKSTRALTGLLNNLSATLVRIRLKSLSGILASGRLTATLSTIQTLLSSVSGLLNNVSGTISKRSSVARTGILAASTWIPTISIRTFLSPVSGLLNNVSGTISKRSSVARTGILAASTWIQTISISALRHLQTSGTIIMNGLVKREYFTFNMKQAIYVMSGPLDKIKKKIYMILSSKE
jgi:hypothetical protein